MSPEAGLVWLSLGAVYLAPAGLAYWWRHPSRHAIAAVNLFLGWTLLGWLAAAYWAGRKRCPFCADSSSLWRASARAVPANFPPELAPNLLHFGHGQPALRA